MFLFLNNTKKKTITPDHRSDDLLFKFYLYTVNPLINARGVYLFFWLLRGRLKEGGVYLKISVCIFILNRFLNDIYKFDGFITTKRWIILKFVCVPSVCIYNVIKDVSVCTFGNISPIKAPPRWGSFIGGAFIRGGVYKIFSF